MFCFALICVSSVFAVVLVGSGYFAVFVFLVFCCFCVARPCSTMGLSTVCDCGINLSYSLFLLPKPYF